MGKCRIGLGIGVGKIGFGGVKRGEMRLGCMVVRLGCNKGKVRVWGGIL